MEDFVRPYKNIFLNLPEWMHDLLGMVFKFLPLSVRYGRKFRSITKIIKYSEWWSEEEINSYQKIELSKLLLHAIKNVPFYQQWYKKNCYNNSDNILQLYNNLPFITREMLKNNPIEFISRKHKSHMLIPTTTGGSTGEPLKFFYERGVTNSAEKAFQWRQRNWAGFHYGEPVVIIRGRGLGGNKIWKRELYDNSLVISGYHLNEELMPIIYKKILSFQPRAIQAYPSNAMLLAKYIHDNHGHFANEKLKVIFCSSENLYDFQKSFLEKVFRCRIYSWYGQGEYVVLAGGCEISDKYHIYPEYGYTELIRPDGSVIVNSGEIGEIVGTGFYNYAMPLIRYRTGDYAEYDDKYCECGRKYRIFKKIYGREQNFIVLNNGHLISLTGLILGQHFKAFDNIQKFQLEQNKPGKITLRIIKTDKFTNIDEQDILYEFNLRVGNLLETKIEYVERIPTTKTGKHLFLIQKIDFSSQQYQSLGLIYR